MSGYYLFWNRGQENLIQVVQSMNYKLATNMCILTKDKELKYHAFQDHKPDSLDIVAAIYGNMDRVDMAIDAYNETDKNKKPILRAREAFQKAFGRQPKTATLWWEAKALADIVARWKEREGIHNDIIIGDTHNFDSHSSGRIVNIVGTARITKDPKRKYPTRYPRHSR